MRISIINGTTKQIYFVSVIFFLFLLCGVIRAYTAFLFHQLDAKDSIIRLDNIQKSWIASFAQLLGPLGCILSGICMDVIGRKYSQILTYVPFITSFLIIGYAKNVEMLYVAFLLIGVGVGMCFCITTYVTEICTSKYRGALFAIVEINYNCGILLGNFIMDLIKWDIAAVIFAILSAIGALLTAFLPESPVWLYLKGKTEKSITTLCKMRCQNKQNLQLEIGDLEKYCTLKKKNDYRTTLRNCSNAWRQLLILVVLFICTVNTGYIAMSVFPIMIIDGLNLPYDSAQITVIYSVVAAVASFFMPLFMHKFSRKTVTITSSVGMGLSYLGVVLFQFVDDITYQTYVWVIPLLIYFLAFVASLGVIPIAFIVGGELFPNESRGVLSGIYGIISYLYLSGLQKVYPIFLNELGVVFMLSCSCILCFVMSLYVYFFVPETKGKTLNEIQEQYFKKKGET